MQFTLLVTAVLGHGWKVCDVTKYGAVADNKTSCTAAFRAAISDCGGVKGGVVLVPFPKVRDPRSIATNRSEMCNLDLKYVCA